MLHNTANHTQLNLAKYIWVDINDDSRGTYSTGSQIKFKTAILKSGLCDSNDAYIFVRGTISVAKTAAKGTGGKNNNKKVVFENRASFNDWISEINNTQVDNAKDIDVVMPIYSLIEYTYI